ncbi:ABC transporter ATP-binding protein [Thermaerobacillus caldiproteolyticus]|uniref:ABC-2 type transport system ATP-binding protein n=1 Tax=Thermaerobacillus caldiproteolyticus TaxID=247480 RepID=A0A7V9Z4E7_9BACL|nr:ABC transporter ATP-binding protein [Anoxybacillus caldiproteolyticus]MBA2873750.1 ABC-2 type transport system ATP-binding protein [Anoxybacillus caldiproteolyticus]QPA30313.1 ABC transporter ATP-binding protein [Anoxybacillus caldiproteolyticus]
MIQLKNVTKKYGNVVALDDISLSMEKGKIIGVLGANGSGKSTFLKLIAGLVFPTNGKVFVDGHEVTRRIGRNVAYLSELDAYYDGFTVQDMLEFYASQFMDFNMEKARDILDFMQIEPVKKLKHLSKGGRGRAKIAFALAREVPVLLMDEPLSGLDPMVRELIIKGLISFVDLEKQTIVMTTHEVDEVESLLDEVIFLRDGKVVERAFVDELREKSRCSVAGWLKKIYEGEEKQ